jgi:triacylglycerol lipase
MNTSRPPVIPPQGAVGAAGRLAWRVGRAVVVQASEVALVASVATNMVRQLVGGNDDRTGDSSPAVAARGDPLPPPVLLVHGFCGTKSTWSLLAETLSAHGLIVVAGSYPSFGTSVEQLADHLVAEVEQIVDHTGAQKVHLVGHSLGGVVIAQAIASGRLDGRVDTVVTLGSPFGGSPWASLLPFGGIARALRGGSPLLRRLASAPVPEGVRWLSFTATFDMIVPGLRSVPRNADVQAVTVGNVGHNGMLMNTRVIRHIVDALPGCGYGPHAPAHAVPA